MSGEDVRVDAGAAEATGRAGEPETELSATLRGRGPKRVEAHVPGKGGRRSKRRERVAAIVAAAAEMGDDATRDLVAQRLARTDEWGEPSGDYKRDVRAAGGWDAVLRRVQASPEEAE